MSESLENLGATHGFLENIAVTDGSLEFQWRIPNFFSRVLKCNFEVQSTHFEFLGAKYVLHMEFDFECSTHFHIDILCQTKDEHLNHMTNYTMRIKCFDGSVYKSVGGTVAVEPALSCARPRLFFSQSDLLLDKKKIAPQDILTIFCRLDVLHGYSERTTADSATQTEISRGIHASTEIIEKYLHQAEDEESSGKDALSDLKGADKLVEDVKGLLLNGTQFDVTIKISDREFRAHRAILGARSSVFQSMFSHDTTERNTGKIEIEDSDPDVFQDFLLFLYSGKMQKLSLENVTPLYTLVDKYDVQEVKRECLKFMIHNFSVGTFCDVVALALKHNEKELLDTATNFFIKNTQKIIFTTEWQSFLKHCPTECNELYIKAIRSRDQK